MFNLYRKFKQNHGQIATVLVLLIAVIFLFTMMSVNLGQLAVRKTTLSNACDGAALILASNLTSISHHIYDKIGGIKDCDINWNLVVGIIVGVVLIAIAIIIAIFAPPAAPAAAAGAGEAMGGGAAGAGAASGAGTAGAAGGATIAEGTGVALTTTAPAVTAPAVTAPATTVAVTAPTTLGAAAPAAGGATAGITATEIAGGFAMGGLGTLVGFDIKWLLAPDMVASLSRSLRNLTLARNQLRESAISYALFNSGIDDIKKVKDEHDDNENGSQDDEIPQFFKYYSQRVRSLKIVERKAKELIEDFAGPLRNFGRACMYFTDLEYENSLEALMPWSDIDNHEDYRRLIKFLRPLEKLDEIYDTPEEQAKIDEVLKLQEELGALYEQGQEVGKDPEVTEKYEEYMEVWEQVQSMDLGLDFPYWASYLSEVGCKESIDEAKKFGWEFPNACHLIGLQKELEWFNKWVLIWFGGSWGSMNVEDPAIEFADIFIGELKGQVPFIK
ncbi:MAG: Tad domain-containing protein, partial [Candidatus Omnitrophota bacterium]